MKLFSWAQRKLPHNASLEKKTLTNADRFYEAPKASEEDLQASTNKETHDIEILTIGTLGMGNLLSMHAKDDDDDDDEDEDDHTHDDEEEKHELAPNVSPNRASAAASPNRTSASPNRASTSPNHASTSPNRESVSSVDMQKLQEELQKILYFKLGGPCKSEKSTTREGSRRKKDNNNNTNNDSSKGNNDGRSHVQGERGGAFPLHNFLEMPMDALPPPAAPLMHTKQWSLQSFRRKFLYHFSSPTRVRVSPSLFEKLMKPKASGSKAEKLFQLLRRMSASHKSRKNYEGSEENEDDRLKLALSRSRGSERFIEYVSKVADFAEHQNQLIIHCTSSTLADREGQVQIMLNSPPANECWIKTDDEYLVLEL